VRTEIEGIWQRGFQAASVEVVRGWLAQKPSLVSVPVDCTLKSGSVRRWSPLFVASNRLRDLDKVKALVEAGADLSNGKHGTHWPSEDYAINAYFIERGIDVNQPSYLGFHAIGVTGLNSFFLMLEHGLDPDSTWPHNGESLLHVQARHDDDAHLARAHALIRAGANVNVQALSGLDEEPIMDNEHFVQFGRETPLHFAARLGNIEQVRLLLAHGADPSLRTVSKMVEPKQFVDWPTDVSALMWPKSTFQQLVFAPYDGETPLEMAVRAGHDPIAEMLRAHSS
jgi:ankyrin repeat protein